ncbi:MAG: GNAT family N-acetyltransferase [Alphaproteobacteria bacterium PA2]|nr:MAG: GNAT family N-acetyltransferase [Alphaproteobacteria bacterium PA2]
MMLVKATAADLTAAAALVNSAYRGDSSRQGWTTEADYVDGQRTDPETLARELAEIPGARLMLVKAGDEIKGTVWLEPKTEEVWYLGMLVVRPGEQDQGSGRAILAAAEDLARAEGARRMEMTVISIRAELIAWYERRGYQKTGETRPFPYDIPRFGEPQVPGLEFVVLEKIL